MPDSWNCDTQKSWTFALKSPMTNLWLTWEVRWYGPFGPHSPDIVLQLPKFSCLPGPLLKNLNHNLPECHCLGISGRLHQHSTHGKLQTAKLLTDWQTQKGMTLSLKNQPVEKLLWYIDLQKLQGKSCFFVNTKQTMGFGNKFKTKNAKTIQKHVKMALPTKPIYSTPPSSNAAPSHMMGFTLERSTGVEILESSLPLNMKNHLKLGGYQRNTSLLRGAFRSFLGRFPDIIECVYWEYSFICFVKLFPQLGQKLWMLCKKPGRSICDPNFETLAYYLAKLHWVSYWRCSSDLWWAYCNSKDTLLHHCLKRSPFLS